MRKIILSKEKGKGSDSLTLEYVNHYFQCETSIEQIVETKFNSATTEEVKGKLESIIYILNMSIKDKRKVWRYRYLIQ